ncbi:MAG: YARHG domain-containing protein [Eubacteriales bacterium]|nr:YARHG domain-containing protein [Eubacteriales bacterium]
MNKLRKKLMITLAAIAAVLTFSMPAMASTTIDVSQTVIWSPDPNEYVVPDGNVRYMTQSELNGYSDLYLLIARNEFYARHGYIFNDQNIARYFNCKNWYRGTVSSGQFSTKVFNDYEKYNIDLLVGEESRRGSVTTTIPWVDNTPKSTVKSTGTTIDVTQTIIWSPDPNAYVIPDVSSRYISSGELSNFSNLYLLIARNEIYARHGYIFNDQNIARYFNCKNWYYGTTSSKNFSDAVFNDYEKSNLDVILTEESRRGSTVTTIAWTN